MRRIALVDVNYFYASIFRPGFSYVKSGVMRADIGECGVAQLCLFGSAPVEDEKRARPMPVVDKASAKWGRGTLAPGGRGERNVQRWAMSRRSMAPAYTTRWDELTTGARVAEVAVCLPPRHPPSRATADRRRLGEVRALIRGGMTCWQQ